MQLQLMMQQPSLAARPPSWGPSSWCGHCRRQRGATCMSVLHAGACAPVPSQIRRPEGTSACRNTCLMQEPAVQTPEGTPGRCGCCAVCGWQASQGPCPATPPSCRASEPLWRQSSMQSVKAAQVLMPTPAGVPSCSSAMRCPHSLPLRGCRPLWGALCWRWCTAWPWRRHMASS